MSESLCNKCRHYVDVEFEHKSSRWTQKWCEKNGAPWMDAITIKCINFKERKDEVDTID